MHSRRMGFWFRLAVLIVKPVVTGFTRREWRGTEHLPTSGGVIIAVNHISYADPLVVAHFVYDAGRLPRFLAKVELFRLPLVGPILRGAGQIPVHRYTGNAATALRDAALALRRGECVVVYPEGTVTKDPAYWPMRARTGVARLALDTGVPVIPLAQWGAHHILGRDFRPHLLPRRTVRLTAGPPVDLSAYADHEPTARTLREATELIMDRVRGQLAELRGEIPPTAVYDPRSVTPVAGSDTRRSA